MSDRYNYPKYGSGDSRWGRRPEDEWSRTSSGYRDQQDYENRDYSAREYGSGNYPIRQGGGGQDYDYYRDHLPRQYGAQDYGHRDYPVRQYGTQDYGRDYRTQQYGAEDYGRRDPARREYSAQDRDHINRDYRAGGREFSSENYDAAYGRETSFWDRVKRTFGGKPPKGYRRSDVRIYEDVCERLSQHWDIDARDISVTVKEAEVTLEGTVSNRNGKRLAEDIAADVRGVEDVHNKLRIVETHDSIDQLNSFLRGELSAIETYRMALRTVTDPVIRAQLVQCQQSHERRAGLLRSKIRERNGEPAETAGVWGAFAKTIQAGGDVAGQRGAIAALEEGEDHGIRDYRSDLNDLDVEARQFVKEQLLPEQQNTHRVLSQLKHTVSS